MPKVKGFNHVTINVTDLDRSLKFYTDLGATITHKGNHDAYLEWGSAWFCLQERPDFDAIPPKHIGVDHVAFSVDEADFDEVVQALTTIAKGPITRGVGRSVYFHDPDGTLIEFHTSNLQERMSIWK